MILQSKNLLDNLFTFSEEFSKFRESPISKVKLVILLLSWVPKLLNLMESTQISVIHLISIIILQIIILSTPGHRLDTSKWRTLIFSFALTIPLLVHSIIPETTTLVYIAFQAAPSLLIIYSRNLIAIGALFIVQTVYHSSFLSDDIERLILYHTPEEAITTMKLRASISLIFIISGAFMIFMKLRDYEDRLINAEKQTTYLMGSSHEMRNSVNNIIGNINMSLLDEDRFKIKEYLKNAKVCGDLLLHLVNNILDTGKMSKGELEVNMRSLPIYSTLSDIWRVCSVLISKKGLGGMMYISKQVPEHVETDAYRLTQIIFNLVSNALKFTSQGSINITVDWISKSELNDSAFGPHPFDEDGIYDRELHTKRLDLNYLPVSSMKVGSISELSNNENTERKGILKISVHDTGCGMTMDKLDKLFKRFSQVSDSQIQREAGTGLGLYITRELCHIMGGEVRAFSKAGAGTCFVTCLPVHIPCC